jgi:hypothetical protein
MPALKTYSYKRAGELLREDEPYSVRTVERMAATGDLERIGERQRRGISERSIIAYQQGERGIWGANAKKNQQVAESLALAMLPRQRTGRGSGISQSNRVDTTLKEDSIPARLPKLGVIRS